MDINAIWILTLSIAAPIAGIVGFSIQLRQVKKTRLENEKLLLEIEELKNKAKVFDQRIIPATNEEVLSISYRDRPMFSRRGTHNQATSVTGYESLKEKAIEIAFILIALLVLIYFIYDLIRLFQWLAKTL